MTSPALRAWTLADVVAAEEAQVAAGHDGCGYSCHCHGDVTCLRLPHPHDPDADMGVDPRSGLPRARGNVVPHVGRNAAGELVQWVCTDPVAQAMTLAEHEQAAQDARAEHTRQLLATLDPAVLRAFVTEVSR